MEFISEVIDKFHFDEDKISCYDQISELLNLTKAKRTHIMNIVHIEVIE